MSLVLLASRSWMWDALWRWQAEHRYALTGEGVRWTPFDPAPHEAAGTRPVEPDRALFVADHGAFTDRITGEKHDEALFLILGLGLHETKGYLFLDDLTTNPDAPVRLRYRAVELALRAAQQYAVSVGKPICAFTAKPSLYRMAKRLGFGARPQGALLVFAQPAIELGNAHGQVLRAQKKSGPPLEGPDSPLRSERNASVVRQRRPVKVPSQDVKARATK